MHTAPRLPAVPRPGVKAGPAAPGRSDQRPRPARPRPAPPRAPQAARRAGGPTGAARASSSATPPCRALLCRPPLSTTGVVEPTRTPPPKPARCAPDARHGAAHTARPSAPNVPPAAACVPARLAGGASSAHHLPSKKSSRLSTALSLIILLPALARTVPAPTVCSPSSPLCHTLILDPALLRCRTLTLATFHPGTCMHYRLPFPKFIPLLIDATWPFCLLPWPWPTFVAYMPHLCPCPCNLASFFPIRFFSVIAPSFFKSW